jgi:hypothetical protein
VWLKRSETVTCGSGSLRLLWMKDLMCELSVSKIETRWTIYSIPVGKMQVEQESNSDCIGRIFHYDLTRIMIGLIKATWLLTLQETLSPVVHLDDLLCNT